MFCDASSYFLAALALNSDTNWSMAPQVCSRNKPNHHVTLNKQTPWSIHGRRGGGSPYLAEPLDRRRLHRDGGHGDLHGRGGRGRGRGLRLQPLAPLGVDPLRCSRRERRARRCRSPAARCRSPAVAQLGVDPLQRHSLVSRLKRGTKEAGAGAALASTAEGEDNP